MATGTLTRKFSCNGWVKTATKQFTGDAFDEVTVAIAADAEDYQVDIAVDASQIQVIFFESADSELLLEANSAVSAGADFDLVVDEEGILWCADDGTNSDYTNPITADVTSFFVTNTGGVATTLHIGLLRDSTP